MKGPFDIPPLKLMFATGTAKEQDIKEIIDFNSDWRQLLTYITSRRIIQDAIWTKYRKQKLTLLLDQICAIDNDTYLMKQILDNVIVVHWNNENVNTIYRLIY